MANNQLFSDPENIILAVAMDDSSYRQNFDLGKNGIHHHSQKEDPKIGQIAKFGREVL